jgi:threonine dehydrogenase-like Zn-dependent dehydrogenase
VAQSLQNDVDHALTCIVIDLVERLIALTGGGADYVIEATGAPVSIRNGWKVRLGPSILQIETSSLTDVQSRFSRLVAGWSS